MSVVNRPTKPAQSDAAADWWMFFRKFVQHGTKIASFAPSSKYLARKICKGIDYDAAKCIVELGAGTGPVTEVLLSHVKPHTRLLVVERDPDFCRRLRDRFPDAEIVEGDAAKIGDLLRERGIRQVDHVVSGLPLPSFPAELRAAVLASVAECLAPGGTFRQLTVTPLVYWKLYRGYFDTVRFKFEARNLPPAGVYICTGYQPRPESPAPPVPA